MSKSSNDEKNPTKLIHWADCPRCGVALGAVLDELGRRGIVQLMVEGEIRRLWIPAELAYGYSGNGPIGQLVFDIELLEIKD